MNEYIYIYIIYIYIRVDLSGGGPTPCKPQANLAHRPFAKCLSGLARSAIRRPPFSLLFCSELATFAQSLTDIEQDGCWKDNARKPALDSVHWGRSIVDQLRKRGGIQNSMSNKVLRKTGMLQEPLNAPSLDGLFSSGFSRGKTAP